MNMIDVELFPVGSLPPEWPTETLRPAVLEKLASVNATGTCYLFADSPLEAETLINCTEDILSDFLKRTPDSFVLQKQLLWNDDPVLRLEHLVRDLWSNPLENDSFGKRKVVLLEGSYWLPPWFPDRYLNDMDAVASRRNTCFIFCFSREAGRETCFWSDPLCDRLLVPSDPFDPSSDVGKSFICQQALKIVNSDFETLENEDRDKLEEVYQLILDGRPGSRDEVSFWLKKYAEPSFPSTLSELSSRIQMSPVGDHTWTPPVFAISREELHRQFEEIRQATVRLNECFKEIFPNQSLFQEWDWTKRRNPFEFETPSAWLEALVTQLYCSYHDAGNDEFQTLARYRLNEDGDIIGDDVNTCFQFIFAFRNLLFHACPQKKNEKTCKRWLLARKFPFPEIPPVLFRELTRLIMVEWANALSEQLQVLNTLAEHPESMVRSKITDCIDNIMSDHLKRHYKQFSEDHTNSWHYRFNVEPQDFADENIICARRINCTFQVYAASFSSLCRTLIIFFGVNDKFRAALNSFANMP